MLFLSYFFSFFFNLLHHFIILYDGLSINTYIHIAFEKEDVLIANFFVLFESPL